MTNQTAPVAERARGASGGATNEDTSTAGTAERSDWRANMASLLGRYSGVYVWLALVLVGVDSFIVTLGMSSVLLALTQLVGGGAFIGPLPDAFQGLASGSILGIPVLGVYALIVALLIWYVLEHHPIGRRAYATGLNPEAARLAGVRTARYMFGSLVLAGFMSALAGVLVASKIGTVSPTLGPAYMLPSFAACLLGTTQIKVGRFNVWGTILALVLLATGVKGVQLVGGQLWLTDLFNGVALIGAVTLAVLARKRRAARIKADQAARGRRAPSARHAGAGTAR